MFKSADLGKEKIKELTEDIINQCKDRIDPDFDIIKKKYESKQLFCFPSIIILSR